MLPLIVKIIGSILLIISSAIISNNILHNQSKKITKKNLAFMIPIIIVTCAMYKPEYSSLLTLTIYMILILTIRKIQNTTVSVAILLSTLALLIFAIVDVVVTSLELMLFDHDTIRNVWYINILNNTLICLLSISISKLKKIAIPFEKLCTRINKKSYEEIIFCITIIIVMALFYYNIANIFEFNIAYVITLVCMFIFIILYYFYAIEKNNYEKLNDEYNSLFDYVQTFENWIDDEQMYRHELKNNLAIIRNMTKDKQIISKIDEMLKFSIIIDNKAIEDLKNIPKGGLKGLLYYKIAISKNQKVKMIVEVSSKVEKKLKQLTNEEMRQLCIIIGIYLDNAIEASSQSKKRIVTLEIYELNKILNFTISNTYKDLVPLKEMKKKGFSTKGENRGKGLYYANKILNRTKWLESTQLFLNDYFIQQIKIKFVK